MFHEGPSSGRSTWNGWHVGKLNQVKVPSDSLFFLCTYSIRNAEMKFTMYFILYRYIRTSSINKIESYYSNIHERLSSIYGENTTEKFSTRFRIRRLLSSTATTLEVT